MSSSRRAEDQVNTPDSAVEQAEAEIITSNNMLFLMTLRRQYLNVDVANPTAVTRRFREILNELEQKNKALPDGVEKVEGTARIEELKTLARTSKDLPSVELFMLVSDAQLAQNPNATYEQYEGKAYEKRKVTFSTLEIAVLGYLALLDKDKIKEYYRRKEEKLDNITPEKWEQFLKDVTKILQRSFFKAISEHGVQAGALDRLIEFYPDCPLIVNPRAEFKDFIANKVLAGFWSQHQKDMPMAERRRLLDSLLLAIASTDNAVTKAEKTAKIIDPTTKFFLHAIHGFYVQNGMQPNPELLQKQKAFLLLIEKEVEFVPSLVVLDLINTTPLNYRDRFQSQTSPVNVKQLVVDVLGLPFVGPNDARKLPTSFPKIDGLLPDIELGLGIVAYTPGKYLPLVEVLKSEGLFALAMSSTYFAYQIRYTPHLHTMLDMGQRAALQASGYPQAYEKLLDIQQLVSSLKKHTLITGQYVTPEALAVSLKNLKITVYPGVIIRRDECTRALSTNDDIALMRGTEGDVGVVRQEIDAMIQELAKYNDNQSLIPAAEWIAQFAKETKDFKPTDILKDADKIITLSKLIASSHAIKDDIFVDPNPAVLKITLNAKALGAIPLKTFLDQEQKKLIAGVAATIDSANFSSTKETAFVSELKHNAAQTPAEVTRLTNSLQAILRDLKVVETALKVAAELKQVEQTQPGFDSHVADIDQAALAKTREAILANAASYQESLLRQIANDRLILLDKFKQVTSVANAAAKTKAERDKMLVDLNKELEAHKVAARNYEVYRITALNAFNDLASKYPSFVCKQKAFQDHGLDTDLQTVQTTHAQSVAELKRIDEIEKKNTPLNLNDPANYLVACDIGTALLKLRMTYLAVNLDDHAYQSASDAQKKVIESQRLADLINMRKEEFRTRLREEQAAEVDPVKKIALSQKLNVINITLANFKKSFQVELGFRYVQRLNHAQIEAEEQAINAEIEAATARNDLVALAAARKRANTPSFKTKKTTYQFSAHEAALLVLLALHDYEKFDKKFGDEFYLPTTPETERRRIFANVWAERCDTFLAYVARRGEDFAMVKLLNNIYPCISLSDDIEQAYGTILAAKLNDSFKRVCKKTADTGPLIVSLLGCFREVDPRALLTLLTQLDKETKIDEHATNFLFEHGILRPAQFYGVTKFERLAEIDHKVQKKCARSFLLTLICAATSNATKLPSTLSARDVLERILELPYYAVDQSVGNIIPELDNASIEVMQQVRNCLLMPGHQLIDALSSRGIFSIAMSSAYFAHLVRYNAPLFAKLSAEQRTLVLNLAAVDQYVRGAGYNAGLFTESLAELNVSRTPEAMEKWLRTFVAARKAQLLDVDSGGIAAEKAKWDSITKALHDPEQDRKMLEAIIAKHEKMLRDVLQIKRLQEVKQDFVLDDLPRQQEQLLEIYKRIAKCASEVDSTFVCDKPPAELRIAVAQPTRDKVSFADYLQTTQRVLTDSIEKQADILIKKAEQLAERLKTAPASDVVAMQQLLTALVEEAGYLLGFEYELKQLEKTAKENHLTLDYQLSSLEKKTNALRTALVNNLELYYAGPGIASMAVASKERVAAMEQHIAAVLARYADLEKQDKVKCDAALATLTNELNCQSNAINVKKTELLESLFLVDEFDFLEEGQVYLTLLAEHKKYQAAFAPVLEKIAAVDRMQAVAANVMRNHVAVLFKKLKEKHDAINKRHYSLRFGSISRGLETFCESMKAGTDEEKAKKAAAEKTLATFRVLGNSNLSHTAMLYDPVAKVETENKMTLLEALTLVWSEWHEDRETSFESDLLLLERLNKTKNVADLLVYLAPVTCSRSVITDLPKAINGLLDFCRNDFRKQYSVFAAPADKVALIAKLVKAISNNDLVALQAMLDPKAEMPSWIRGFCSQNEINLTADMMADLTRLFNVELVNVARELTLDLILDQSLTDANIAAQFSERQFVSELFGLSWVTDKDKNKLPDLSAHQKKSFAHLEKCLLQANHPLVSMLSHAGIFALTMASPEFAYFVRKNPTFYDKLSADEKTALNAAGHVKYYEAMKQEAAVKQQQLDAEHQRQLAAIAEREQIQERRFKEMQQEQIDQMVAKEKRPLPANLASSSFKLINQYFVAKSQQKRSDGVALYTEQELAAMAKETYEKKFAKQKELSHKRTVLIWKIAFLALACLSVIGLPFAVMKMRSLVKEYKKEVAAFADPIMVRTVKKKQQNATPKAKTGVLNSKGELRKIVIAETKDTKTYLLTEQQSVRFDFSAKLRGKMSQAARTKLTAKKAASNEISRRMTR